MIHQLKRDTSAQQAYRTTPGRVSVSHVGYWNTLGLVKLNSPEKDPVGKTIEL